MKDHFIPNLNYSFVWSNCKVTHKKEHWDSQGHLTFAANMNGIQVMTNIIKYNY